MSKAEVTKYTSRLSEPVRNAAAALEPKVNEHGEVSVMGLSLGPTSILTALLFGFANHTDTVAREFFFWRIADEIWNHPDLPEPLFEPNPWAQRMVRAAIRNKYLAVGGAASSSKSHTMAGWGIVNWLARPANTLVLVTSTTLREARKRIWGSIITLMSVIEDVAPCKIRDSIGSIAYVNEGGTLFDKAGISLIAAEKSRTREAVGKFIGIKQENVILIGDELSEISEAVIEAGLSNLSKNKHFQMIGMSNPNSRFDAFGSWSEPLKGWSSVELQTADEWVTKYKGLYIRLDGERSPNILAGEVLYPYLPTAKKLQEDKELMGENSRGYMRMVRAVFFDDDGDNGIYSEAEMVRSGAMNPAQWSGETTMVAGVDPAFTNGGDRTILYTGRVGLLDNGQYAMEFLEAVPINDDATDKSMPRSYQIVQQIKKECERRGISPFHVAVDATAAGAPLCDVLAGEWSDEILRVSFGAKASDRRVSASSTRTGEELYVNRVSELWFVGKELMRTGQIRGIGGDLAKEMVGRGYEMTKSSSSLRVRIESKAEYKAKHGLSPDIADAAFLALDCARQRLGLVAVEPPRDSEGAVTAFARPPRTLRSLGGATMNENARLLT